MILIVIVLNVIIIIIQKIINVFQYKYKIVTKLMDKNKNVIYVIKIIINLEINVNQ